MEMIKGFFKAPIKSDSFKNFFYTPQKKSYSTTNVLSIQTDNKGNRRNSFLRSYIDIEKEDSEDKHSMVVSFVNIGEEELEEVNYSPTSPLNLNPLTNEEWENVFKKPHFNLESNERRKIDISLIKGIDESLRERIWLYLTNIENLSLNFDKNVYSKFLQKKNTKIEDTIKKDIERTFALIKDHKKIKEMSQNDLENNKTKLFNVLKAYAIFDRKLNYAQGTNFIALMIILHIKDEVESFWLFVDIMVNKNWKDLYLEDSPCLTNLLCTLQKKIKQNLPELYEHFKKENVKYYLFIFSSVNSSVEQFLLFSQQFLFT